MQRLVKAALLVQAMWRAYKARKVRQRSPLKTAVFLPSDWLGSQALKKKAKKKGKKGKKK